jgi:hypothetical protein
MDNIERELREAMRAEVERTEPADSLDAILARTGRVNTRGTLGGRRWFVVGGASLAAAATITAVVVLAQGALSPSPDRSPPVAKSGAHHEVTVPVYYTGLGVNRTSPADDRLYLERRTVAGTGRIGVDAVHALLTLSPRDPDYVNMWTSLGKQPDPVDVKSVTHQVGIIDVELTAAPSGQYASIHGRSPRGELIVQQLVYTVQAALGSTDPVVVAVNGRPVDRLWLTPSNPATAAADPRTVLAPLQFTSPAQGQTVTGPVTIRGLAATFEGNVPWVIRHDGRVVRQGAEIAGSMGVSKPFSFTVDLPPGDYTVRTWESSAENGKLMWEDTKDFTVQ